MAKNLTDTFQGVAPADTILVVAPGPGTLQSIGAALLRAGYQIEGIQEGDLQSLSSLPEDVSVAVVVAAGTGVSHPQADEVCSVLKLREPTLPLIVLGPDVLAIKLRLFALGVDGYVVDSSDRTELLAHIRTLIRKCRFSSTNSAGR